MTKNNTISITLEGALNALAKNKDGDHVAVAGRTGKLRVRERVGLNNFMCYLI